MRLSGAAPPRAAARGDDAAALVAGARADVDDPVAAGDDAHVVLDHDDRVAGVDQAVQLRQQPVDVGGVQAGGRLVEHVERVAALRALQLGGELDALRLAARQLGRRLAEPQVAQADVAQQRAAAARTRGLVGEERAPPRRPSCRSTSAMLRPFQCDSSVAAL